MWALLARSTVNFVSDWIHIHILLQMTLETHVSVTLPTLEMVKRARGIMYLSLGG